MRFDTLEEAIAEANRRADLFGYRYVVRMSWGKYSAVVGNSVDRSKVVWAPPSRKPKMAVPDSPEIRELAKHHTYKEMAAITGYTEMQLRAAMLKYKWEKKPKGVDIDIDELREAMKEMSPKEYAEVKGVMTNRIYFLCRKHNIPRIPQRRGAPRRKNG